MFFDSWAGLGRVLVVGVLAYAALIAMLRVSGNRSLAKMNAFDFVVTVALGSSLATILLSSDVALAEGVLAMALLLGLQFLVTWSSVRSTTVSRLVKSEPRLLLHRGQLLPAQMRAARVVEADDPSMRALHGIPGDRPYAGWNGRSMWPTAPCGRADNPYISAPCGAAFRGTAPTAGTGRTISAPTRRRWHQRVPASGPGWPRCRRESGRARARCE